MDGKESILIVDDDEGTCRSLRLIFRKKGYEAETAGTGQEAIEKARRKFFNLALLDIKLPDTEGIELLAPLKEIHPDMVVIMVTAYASVESAVRALNEGALAYIIKPLDMRGVLAKVRGALQDQRIIEEKRRAEEELAYRATHDALTDLPNRALFKAHLTLALTLARRKQRKLAVMVLDLDRFKNVNDTLGHGAGDQLLQAVGVRLVDLLRESDRIGRMGGDEFTLLLTEVAKVEDAAEVACRILGAVRKPFVIDGHQLHITTSIGIALYPSDGDDPDTLIKNADKAMYRAKKHGRNNYQHSLAKG
ncbi:diguanylate cyclase [bacterium]|nr:diguanylate cyclase [bacterium]